MIIFFKVNVLFVIFYFFLSTLKQSCFQTSKQRPLRQDCITLHHASLPRFTEKQAVDQKHNISEKKYTRKQSLKQTKDL